MNVTAMLLQASRNLGWGKGPWNVEQFGVLVAVVVAASERWLEPAIKPR